MCIDYTDLNKACPKDSYPLPSIDGMVDVASGFRFLSFLDAYSGYNQIPMHPLDEDKIAFITLMGNYCYRVMPFRLKNAGATYQWLMNKIFADHIGVLMKVYIDDMLVKTKTEDELLQNLETVFSCLWEHRMRLNPQKWVFTVEAGEFLGFMLANWGIEANPDKCKAILEMKSPSCVKDVQRLTGRIENNFEWTPECEEAFQEFKTYLSSPPILCKPEIGKPLFLYLSVSNSAIANVLVREDAKQQFRVHFVNKTLQGEEVWYQKLEKVALALVFVAQRLRQYFQAHIIIVRTDQPIR